MAALASSNPQTPAKSQNLVMEAKPQSILINRSRPTSITIGPSRNQSSNSLSALGQGVNPLACHPQSTAAVLQTRDTTFKPEANSTTSSATPSPRHSTGVRTAFRLSSQSHTPTKEPSIKSIAEEVDHRKARVVVGVDWGTTYSGVAIVHSDHPGDIDIIKT